MANRIDISLHIEGVDQEEFARVWTSVMNVAHGYILDGLGVAVEAQRFDEGIGLTNYQEFVTSAEEEEYEPETEDE